MPEPGLHIETLQNTAHYSPAQIDKAAAIAAQMNRGKLVIVEPPALKPTDEQ